MDYGKSFKHYRQNAKLTQKEAAKRIGIKDYQLGNYETNRSEPSLDVLKKMSKVYQISVDKMIGNPILQDNPVEVDKDDYIDQDELLMKLNDIVEKMNKSSKNNKR